MARGTGHRANRSARLISSAAVHGVGDGRKAAGMPGDVRGIRIILKLANQIVGPKPNLEMWTPCLLLLYLRFASGVTF